MGLDVYLHKADRSVAEVRKAKEKADRDYDAIGNEVLKRLGVDKFEALTKEQHGDYFGGVKAICKERGLGEYGEPLGLEEKIEIDSTKYPKHYFKVGYFRSSYNGGGFDRVMDRYGLPGLDEIFPVENLETGEGFDANPPSGGDEYFRTVNWKWSREKAAKALADFRTKLDADGAYSVIRVQPNMFGASPDQPKSDAEALAHWKTERDKQKGRKPDPFFGNHYSNGIGEFAHDGLKVVALLPGLDTMFGQPRQCTYVVVEVEPYVDRETGEKMGPYESYVRSLEIVVETCDYVLAQPDPERFYFHWSG